MEIPYALPGAGIGQSTRDDLRGDRLSGFPFREAKRGSSPWRSLGSCVSGGKGSQGSNDPSFHYVGPGSVGYVVHGSVECVYQLWSFFREELPISQATVSGIHKIFNVVGSWKKVFC